MRERAKTHFARTLRREMTDAERLLWSLLRRRHLNGFRFRRQVPVGPYIADFVCPEARLIIEVDGSQHGSPSDHARDVWMCGNGYRIRRFWNDEVLMRTMEVLAAIDDELLLKSPPSALRAPSPASQGKEKHAQGR